MKAYALMRFVSSGNRSLKIFAVLLARLSLGVFFAISGGNKLFVASQYKLMYETIVGAGIPFPHVMTYFVSSVEFVCGCLLIIGLLSTDLVLRGLHHRHDCRDHHCSVGNHHQGALAYRLA